MMSKGNRTSGTAGDIRITDPSNKNSSDHKKPSPGPLSSIKAAIKRSKPSSQSDQRKGNCRRRPEITVVSAEPLDCSSSSPGSPLVSSALHTPSLQVPTQVPKQRTQEAHIKPVAPPRHLNGTATTATTTTPKSTGLKPPKPPRPSAPKNKKTSTVTDDHTNGILTLEPSHIIQDFDSNSTNCTQSVTVHWNDLKTSSAPHTTFNTASNCLQCPVPLPRIKSKRLLIPQEESKTLVQLSGDSDPSDPVLNSATPNKYLQELLEVFHSEKSYIINQLSAETEDVDKMSATNNLRARIQAFESQAEEASEPGRPQPQARKTRPAVATKPSAVATKPSVVAKPQFISDDLYDNVSSSPPSPAPKPARKPLGKTNSVKDELNAILSQHRSKPPKLTRDVSVHDEGFAKEPPTPMVKPVKEPLKPNLNINNHNNYSTQPVYEDAEDVADDTEDPTYSEYEYVERPSEGFGNAHEFPALDEDNTSQGPDTTESQYEYVEYQTDKAPEKVPPKTYEEKPSNILPVKPKSTMNNYVSRQSLNRRPTTIIVPSKSASFSDGSQDNPPALPVQKPVGARKAPPVNRHSIASFPTQVSHSPTPEPSLPPRRLTTSKTLPPRPPLVKSGPGRPPAPRMEAAGRSNTVPWDSPPQPQATQNRDPVLPPRPNPGHKLYNKYTLQVPHAVAVNDFNGSNSGELSFQKNEVLVLLNTIDPNTYECQVGDRRGRVHRSSLKVITPLTTASDDSATQGDKRTTLSKGLTVKALHDFNPENPGELGLKAGDVVTMVEQVDSEWYRGTCQGSSGFFPINYVKVQANSPRPPDKPAKKPAATVSGPRCVARFDFEGEHSDELSFSEGDTIQLKAFVGQDWARGKLGSVTGIFPLNFVEIIEDLPPGPSQQPTKPIKPTKSTKSTKIALPGMSKSSHTPETSQAQSGSEWSVALYDFSGNSEGDLSFEKGDRILVTKHIDEEWSSGTLNGQEGIFPRAFVSNNKAGKTCSHQNGSAGGVSAKALYDYASDCDEELSLKVGDIVANIEIVDDEWFLGDLKGKRALVPKNYVEVL